jgi:hypothetical protein
MEDWERMTDSTGLLVLEDWHRRLFNVMIKTGVGTDGRIRHAGLSENTMREFNMKNRMAMEADQQHESSL